MQDSEGQKTVIPALESTQNPKRYKRITPLKQIGYKITKIQFSPSDATN